MSAGIAAIAYHLPETVLDNAALEAIDPRFNAVKVKAKTGIDRRHIAAAGECASDLAVVAAQTLFRDHATAARDIDYLILCTQAPDYFLPTTACIVHERLGLRRDAGSVDVNLGCSGFVYGLGLAKGLIASGQAERVLLLTADTYSKFMARTDMSVRSIFGDAAAATLIAPSAEGALGPFVYGSDGAGAVHLIVPTGGLRDPGDGTQFENALGETRRGRPLHMNGPEIFNFTIAAVPELVRATLVRAGIGAEDIDLWVFHQANATMLEALRRKLEVPSARFWIDLAEVGNTVSSTIPIALARAQAAGRLDVGTRLMLVGFGVGYSWAACTARWGATI
jgi:3-oxoacyl-[acyl-carrier-protein] synthase-3